MSAAIEVATSPPRRFGLDSPAQWRQTGLRLVSVCLFFVLWYAVCVANATLFHWFNPLLLPRPD